MYSVVLMAAMTTGIGVPAGGPKVYLGSGGCQGAPCGYDPALQGWPGYGFLPLGGYSNCWGGCSGFYPGVILPPADATPMGPQDKPKSLVPDKPARSADAAPPAPVAKDRARLTVEVPPGARLFLNDQPTRSTTSVRTFLTPPLQVGDTYYYVIRMEAERNGKTVSESKRVLLHPGEEIRARFALPEAMATSAQDP